MDAPNRAASRCPHCPRAGQACRGEELARLCELVDPEHAAFNPAYREVLEPACRDADNPDNPPDHPEWNIDQIPLAESLRLTALARGCPFRSQPACGCDAAACALKRGADVSARTCWDCVRRYG